MLWTIAERRRSTLHGIGRQEPRGARRLRTLPWRKIPAADTPTVPDTPRAGLAVRYLELGSHCSSPTWSIVATLARPGHPGIRRSCNVATPTTPPRMQAATCLRGATDPLVRSELPLRWQLLFLPTHPTRIRSRAPALVAG